MQRDQVCGSEYAFLQSVAEDVALKESLSEAEITRSILVPLTEDS
jgi:hypothetical protein